jgi:hypothetical protein
MNGAYFTAGLVAKVDSFRGNKETRMEDMAKIGLFAEVDSEV